MTVTTPTPETLRHTPTPWRVEQGTDLIWGACNPDDQSSYGMGYAIVGGKTPGWKPYKPSMGEREANAAFIVTAVNSHERLTARVAELTELLLQSKSAMLETRTASIVGAQEGYGKAEEWCERLYVSHGGLTRAMKAIDAALSAADGGRG